VVAAGEVVATALEWQHWTFGVLVLAVSFLVVWWETSKRHGMTR
jgi:hypothetical protein